MTTLFQAYELNKTLTLQNKIIMAPLTRCFAGEGFVATDEMAAYYAKRAGAGLIITEATVVAPSGHGYPNTSGIYTEEQIAGWKKVTDAVHAEGGTIFMQLWHVGRISHSIYLDGDQPVAPSALAHEGRIPRTDDLQYPVPRALEIEEIYALESAYIQGAKNAIEAGFDGVEIHGANGYLIDQFLRGSTNERTDGFGGSMTNRTRFALDIVKGICAEVCSDRVGIRLSPGAYVHLEHTSGDEETFSYLLKELEQFNLAYVHTGIFDDSTKFDYLDGGSTEFLRKNYSGTVIASGGYDAAKATAAIDSGAADVVAIGRAFIANPDLVERIKNGVELVDYSEEMLGSLV